MLKYEQSELPLAEGRPIEEVRWFQARQVEKRRLLGKKVISELIIDEKGWAKTTSISVAEISSLKDPNLRYALRFAAAADAVGWVASSEYTSYCHDVGVYATDNGLDSQLINAHYSGIARGRTDTFMENLRRFASDYQEGNKD